MKAQIYSGHWEGYVLQRSIHWIKLGLVRDPKGVFFIAMHAFNSMIDGRDTPEFLDINFEEIYDLVAMVMDAKSQEDFERRLLAYYFPDSSAMAS